MKYIKLDLQHAHAAEGICFQVWGESAYSIADAEPILHQHQIPKNKSYSMAEIVVSLPNVVVGNLLIVTIFLVFFGSVIYTITIAIMNSLARALISILCSWCYRWALPQPVVLSHGGNMGSLPLHFAARDLWLSDDHSPFFITTANLSLYYHNSPAYHIRNYRETSKWGYSETWTPA